MTRYLISFLPWIVYAFVATSDDWRKGALTGLVIAALVVVHDRRSGKHWDEMVIEVSALVYFAITAWISYKSPDSKLIPYGPALVDAWLALTAFGSLVVRRPFTMGIARRMAPEKVWRTPAFYRTNAVITRVWMVAFAAAAVILGIMMHASPHGHTNAVIFVKFASFIIPALFTASYSKSAKARAARARQTV